ncbi:MAG: MATE family efflux transporter [Clostridia bacterium]|uniref:Probable multidrug resistance protein NorM n=2 Tax=Bianquea renquensis TaxID=2763661 RepID=A0A926DQA1_9FIRM|nr:MATE family efflux transporter [Bianquea renquensis]MBC8543220.1 MATE family efflux transporter [Bianquea renquensis]
MDMCSGPLLGKMILFALPLMVSSILQLLFNAADIIVVGKFAGNQALAAVGSTGALINLIVNLFIGLSVGTNVLVARYYGAHQGEDLSETIHTSILASVIGGAILVVIGLVVAEPLLHLMGTPDDVIEQSSLYMRIYFIGMPVNMLYNFGSAILRAVGDTKRPLYFLLVAGVINVVLNLIFVIVFSMGVAGVATATIISQAISALLIVYCLIRSQGLYQLHLKKLRIHMDKLGKMVRIGLPAGMQGAIFSISNVLIQSSINSFGSTVMAGNTAASNIEGFVYVSMNAVHQTTLSFTSQNLGAKQYKRIEKVLLLSLALVTVIGVALGGGAYLLGNTLLRIYSTDAEIIHYGMLRMAYVCVPYFLCGVMEVMVGSLRGLGYSIMPMIVSLAGACGLRILWLYTLFAMDPTLPMLYISYPVSWFVTAAVHGICYLVVRRKFIHKEEPAAPAVE